MKNNILPKIILLITTHLLLLGCSSRYPQEVTPTISHMNTVYPTLTDAPINTDIPTVLPTLAKVIPAKTMTSEEQETFIREFLSGSGSCRLPCWWNITPGQAWVDAEKTIREYGGALVPGIPLYDPEIITYGTSVNVKSALFDATISLEEKQGLVYAWHMLSTGGVKRPEEFRSTWKNYLAQKIVKIYGMPNRILLHGNPASSSLEFGLYSLWMFYDELGFSIMYVARIPMYFFDAPLFRICSESDQLLTINLHTQSPDSFLPLERFDRTLEQLRMDTDVGRGVVIHSLQEATGLSDEELYQAFMQEKDPCLAVPSDIWKPIQ